MFYGQNLFLINLDLTYQPRSDHVKLHITLMNTSFPEYQSSINGDPVNQSRLTFDARKILDVRSIRFINYDKSYTKYNYNCIIQLMIEIEKCIYLFIIHIFVAEFSRLYIWNCTSDRYSFVTKIHN